MKTKRIQRLCGHKWMTHSCPLGMCNGRGCYPEEDQPTDTICACPAGELRLRTDEGERVEVDWPLCEVDGCNELAHHQMPCCGPHQNERL